MGSCVELSWKHIVGRSVCGHLWFGKALSACQKTLNGLKIYRYHNKVFHLKIKNAEFLFFNPLFRMLGPNFLFKRALTKAQEAVCIEDDWRSKRKQELLIGAPDTSKWKSMASSSPSITWPLTFVITISHLLGSQGLHGFKRGRPGGRMCLTIGVFRRDGSRRTVFHVR